jgi:hypothetical protein
VQLHSGGTGSFASECEPATYAANRKPLVFWANSLGVCVKAVQRKLVCIYMKLIMGPAGFEPATYAV